MTTEDSSVLYDSHTWELVAGSVVNLRTKFSSTKKRNQHFQLKCSVQAFDEHVVTFYVSTILYDNWINMFKKNISFETVQLLNVILNL